MWIVELGAAGLAGVERVELPVPRPLCSVTGELDELLGDPGLEAVREHYLCATLTDRVRPVDGMRKLRERFPYAVRLVWTPEVPQETESTRYADAAGGRDEVALADAFAEHCRGAPLSESERQLIGEAFTAAGSGEGAAWCDSTGWS